MQPTKHLQGCADWQWTQEARIPPDNSTSKNIVDQVERLDKQHNQHREVPLREDVSSNPYGNQDKQQICWYREDKDPVGDTLNREEADTGKTITINTKHWTGLPVVEGLEWSGSEPDWDALDQDSDWDTPDEEDPVGDTLNREEADTGKTININTKHWTSLPVVEGLEWSGSEPDWDALDQDPDWDTLDDEDPVGDTLYREETETVNTSEKVKTGDTDWNASDEKVHTDRGQGEFVSSENITLDKIPKALDLYIITGTERGKPRALDVFALKPLGNRCKKTTYVRSPVESRTGKMREAWEIMKNLYRLKDASILCTAAALNLFKVNGSLMKEGAPNRMLDSLKSRTDSAGTWRPWAERSKKPATRRSCSWYLGMSRPRTRIKKKKATKRIVGLGHSIVHMDQEFQ